MSELTVGIVGLGLMGGGIARRLKDAEELGKLPAGFDHCRILASSRNQDMLAAAKTEKVIDNWWPLAEAGTMLSQCDITFVCLYPAMTFDFIKKHWADFKKGSIVTDIAGVKATYLAQFEELENCPVSERVDFISGHPMAGREKEGYAASAQLYFTGRNYILIPRPCNDHAHVQLMRDVITCLGFSHIIDSTAQNHDHKIGFTSQLCHVIASALVASAEDEHITEFGGGSFEDLTRIAMINAPLWTELFLANKEELIGHIDAFTAQMESLRHAISEGDEESLECQLEAVRQRRIAMRKSDS